MADLLRALLRDVLPNATQAYVIGETDTRLQELLDERGITARHPSGEEDEPLALVIASGGLSEFAIAEHLGWQEACDRVAGLLAPGGTLVVGVAGESTLAGLLTTTPALPQPDATRPHSAAQLRDALRRSGLRGTTVHLLFGSPEAPAAALTEAAARSARPGSLAALAVESAVTEQSVDVGSRTLLDPRDALDRATTAGALDLAATGFLAVAGGRGHDVYFTDGDDVVWAEHDSTSGRWVLSDRSLPDTPNLEARLRSELAAADVPAFRELAATIGTFVRTDPLATSVAAVRLHHLTVDRDGRIEWLFPPEQDETGADSDGLLAAMWWDFMHRLGYRRDTLPWPSMMDDESLVRSWLRMSGADEERSSSRVATDPPSSEQADALNLERASERVRLVEDRLRVGTEALHQRDSRLAVRETAIRMMRNQLIDAQQEKVDADLATAKLKRGRAYKLARRITLLSDPKETVRVVGNKLDTSVKRIRRMR